MLLAGTSRWPTCPGQWLGDPTVFTVKVTCCWGLQVDAPAAQYRPPVRLHRE